MSNNEINLNDITIVVNIIDICSQRGAFKGNELATIGQLRDKLARIVDESKQETDTTNVESLPAPTETEDQNE